MICLLFILGPFPNLDDVVLLTVDLLKYVPLFSRLCIKRSFYLESILDMCHVNLIWKARNQLPGYRSIIQVCSKCSMFLDLLVYYCVLFPFFLHLI